jgi:uncharacterized protein (DUF433 family)
METPDRRPPVAGGPEQEADTLIARYLEENPHRPGEANVRVKGYGVSVWALIAQLEAEHGDAARVATDYELPQEAVQAAIAHYHRHRAAIDARIAANAA